MSIHINAVVPWKGYGMMTQSLMNSCNKIQQTNGISPRNLRNFCNTFADNNGTEYGILSMKSLTQFLAMTVCCL